MNAAVLDVPLSQAESPLRDVLVLLADTYVESTWRPCLDGDTTLRDWVEALDGVIS